MQKYHPHIAIIILNWNGLEDTKECLTSVLKNDYPNYSIYIIDNASHDDELKQIKQFCHNKLSRVSTPKTPNTYYIQNKKNLGFSAGNNTGIRQALKKGADYIFTLNNDTVVDRRFLSNIIKLNLEDEDPSPLTSKTTPDNSKKGYRSSPSRDHIGIIATTMVNYYDRNKLDNTGHDLLSTGDTIPRERNSENPKSKSHTSRLTPKPILGACAGAAIYSAQMLKQIGLFDPDFFLNYEDSDLSLRAITQGWQIRYCPNSIIYHKINASIKKVKNTKYRIRSQRNQLWAYLHNTPLLVIILNSPLIISRDLLVIIISLLTFRFTITWIFIRSRLEVLRTLPQILRKRRKVMQGKKVSSIWFWKQQKSALSSYWQYFLDIIIKRKNTVMDD